MYYTNEMKITLKSTEIASKALKMLHTQLNDGFNCDKGYMKAPSKQMLDSINVIDNRIVLPENFGCLTPEDAEDILCELIQALAESLREDFTCEIYNYSDYNEGTISAQYAEGTLKIKSIFYPIGYCNFYCEECDEEVVRMDEYEVGKVYTCPECGEELDLSDWAPIITEKTIQIG